MTPRLSSIAAEIDGYPEGRDAAVLASMFERATGAGVTLIMVVSGERGVPPWVGAGAAIEQAEAMLTGTRDRFAAGARMVVETDASVSRRWGPVVRLLLGSTGEALMHDASCPILVAPRPSG